MTAIKDKGALVAALVAIAIALATWIGSEGAKNQQIADVAAEVQTLEQQVQQMQSALNQYLYTHDGH